MKEFPENRTEYYYQLALSRVESVGLISAKKLVRHFGSAQTVFQTAKRDLMQVPGMRDVQAANIAKFGDYARVDQEFNFIEKEGIRVYSFMETDYPSRLKHCVDAPMLLYSKGNVKLSVDRMVSIVGTRRITDYGKKVCSELVKALAQYDVTVVSGMAYGVDIEAHKACIQLGVPTVGVMAHGLDRIYPNSHTRHAMDMVHNGGIVTEYISGTQPDRENFPQRNRIVAGLTDATIVVESGYKGGSIITANLANGYNRDVFAIPGTIYDSQSAGCNLLIKSHRAALLESAKDLEYIMGWNIGNKPKAVQKKIFVDLNPEETKLIDFLNEKGKTQIDELCIGIEMTMSSAMVHLLNLELNGMVRSLPGKLYETC